MIADFAGDATDATGTDAVGQRNRDPLQAKCGLLGDESAVEVLVRFLAARVGMLPDRNRQIAPHIFPKQFPAKSRSPAV